METSALRRYMNMKTAIPCLLLSALGSLSACTDAGAATHQDHEIATRRVNYADLDLNRSEGAATLYSRIRSAAKYVCRPGSDNWEWTPSTNRCTEQAIARAVADVNAPALTSYHAAHTRQPLIRLAQGR